MLKSRRDSSNKLYAGYMGRWERFCSDRSEDTIFTSTRTVLSFLQSMVSEGFSYSAVNVAKCAVGACTILSDGQPLGTQQDIIMFMRGAYNTNPPVVRNREIWSPDIVLSWMSKTDTPENSPSEMLVRKLVVLILLVTGQRPQILGALRLSDLKISENQATFSLQSHDVKQGRLGYTPPILLLRKYVDPKLCVFNHLLEYVKRTKSLREGHDKLFLTCKKPFHPATMNTLSRWVKGVLKSAGIDISLYGAGSTRAASTSQAAAKGMPIDALLKTAGWSQQSTFGKFYNKKVVAESSLDEFLLPRKKP